VSFKPSGVPVPGLRVWSALVARATVAPGGLIGREFGSRRARLLATIGTATRRCCRGLSYGRPGRLPAPAGLALVVARIGRTRAQDRRGP
jgi:hypothetical protein